MTHPVTELELYRVLLALERISTPVQDAVLLLVTHLDAASERMIVSQDAATRQAGCSLRKVLFSLNRRSWRSS